MAGMQVLGTTCNSFSISLEFFLSLGRSTEQEKENSVFGRGKLANQSLERMIQYVCWTF